jgi:ribonuclease G
VTDESPREEILINVTPREIRAALLENGVLQEVHIEREARRGLISNIYKGSVTRVLPGMQAAFVDIGLDRTAFLHVSDIVRRGEPDGAEDDEPLPDIRGLVHESDEILVQVVKDPLGSKGARLTTFITLPSRFLVYLPAGSGIGVSSRIEDETERNRLRNLLERLQENLAGGLIVRTAADGIGEATLASDLEFLQKLWSVIQLECSKAPAKSLVHEDLSLATSSESWWIQRNISTRCSPLPDVFCPRSSPCSSCTRGAGRFSTCTVQKTRFTRRLSVIFL